MQNNGIGNILLRKVVVNSDEIPSKVELGVSRGLRNVFSSPEEHPDVTFHSIDKYIIKPERSIEDKRNIHQLTDNNDKILYYGVKISYDRPIQFIESVSIHYSYFGVRLKTRITVSTD